MKIYWLRSKIFPSLLSLTQPSATSRPHPRASTSRCTTIIEGGRPTRCNSMHEKLKNEIPTNWGRKMAMFEHRLYHQIMERPKVPRTFLTTDHMYSPLTYWLESFVVVACCGCNCMKFSVQMLPVTIFHHAHQRLRPNRPYMVVLLSSHYDMIAATPMDLHPWMR